MNPVIIIHLLRCIVNSTIGKAEIMSPPYPLPAQDVRNGIKGRKFPRNKDSPDYPLRGIKCGGCGKSISGGKTKGKTKYYQYYGCFNGVCEKRAAIKRNEMHNDFTKFLTELTPNDDFFEVLKEAVKIAHKAELNSVTSSERKINLKIVELKEKKVKLLDLKFEGGMATSEFLLNNGDLNHRIKDLENSLIALSPPELGVERVIESGIEFLKHLPENWKDLDVKDLRVLRPLLFPQNIFYAYPTIKTPELCCIYNVKSQSDEEKNHWVTLRGIGHRSRLASLARDPDSDAFASSVFRFCPPGHHMHKIKNTLRCLLFYA